MSFAMENCQKPVGRQFSVVKLYFLFPFIFDRKKTYAFLYFSRKYNSRQENNKFGLNWKRLAFSLISASECSIEIG